MDTPYAPQFDPLTFNPAIDRMGEWQAGAYPWKRIELPKLYRRKEFMSGDGWGRNAWGERFKGDSVTRFYAAVPEGLISTHNIALVYQGRIMRILCHAQPAFTRPRSRTSPELVCFFRWIGREE